MNIHEVKDIIAYVDRCLTTIEGLEEGNPLIVVLEDAANHAMTQIINQRTDGGPGSGNWGHVGVKGQWGGSAPGGGNGFRMWNNRKNEFTSQAKQRDETLRDMKSNNKRKRAAAVKRAQRINMGRKSAENLMQSGKYDPNASKNILNDPKQGKGKGSVYGISGTTNAINNLVTKGQKQEGFKYPDDPKPQPQQQPQAQPQQPKSPTDINSYTTSKPTDNANYQRAINIDINDSAALSSFYKQARRNAVVHPGDTRSRDNGRIQKLINYMGYDTTKPDAVDSRTFAQLSKGNEVFCRGTGGGSYTHDDFVDADYTRMGGIVHGTGIYFGASKSSAYGTDIRAIPKPDAKILSVNTSGRDANGKRWGVVYTDGKRNSSGARQYQDAIMAGYDAVRINFKGAGNNGPLDYVMVYNRGAFVVEDKRLD